MFVVECFSTLDTDEDAKSESASSSGGGGGAQNNNDGKKLSKNQKRKQVFALLYHRDADNHNCNVCEYRRSRW